MVTKSDLRRIARLLSPATDQESESVCGRLAELIPEGATVCIYLPMVGEVDLTSLPDRIDAEWVTTRTPARGPLTLHPLEADRERHRFGFEQPAAGAPSVQVASVGWFCVPGLAFDRRGSRLGHGMGYYDRLLSDAAPAARLIGVALERRVFEMIPVDDHDVPMHAVVTERRVIRP